MQNDDTIPKYVGYDENVSKKWKQQKEIEF